MIQQKITKLKGVADIVFCIDFSGSMASCIDGVKNNINSFVSSIEKSNPNMLIDWQIAFCAYSDNTLIIQNFTKNTKEFSNNLESLELMGDEFTPGAIDYSISSFNWRKISNKFLIVFTDEELTGGSSYGADGDGSAKFPQLIKKIEDSRIRLYYFGPQCSYYSQFERISRCMGTYLDGGNFSTVDFSSLLSSLGKTVSQSCNQQGQETGSLSSYIYNFSSFNIKKL